MDPGELCPETVALSWVSRRHLVTSPGSTDHTQSRNPSLPLVPDLLVPVPGNHTAGSTGCSAHPRAP